MHIYTKIYHLSRGLGFKLRLSLLTQTSNWFLTCKYIFCIYSMRRLQWSEVCSISINRPQIDNWSMLVHHNLKPIFFIKKPTWMGALENIDSIWRIICYIYIQTSNMHRFFSIFSCITKGTNICMFIIENARFVTILTAAEN